MNFDDQVIALIYEAISADPEYRVKTLIGFPNAGGEVVSV